MSIMKIEESIANKSPADGLAAMKDLAGGKKPEFSSKSSLTEYWFYRELFFFLVWRDIKVRYKQTALGASWAMIQPFFTMIVFTLLFGKLAKLPNDGMPYPIFYYSALVPWIYFATALSNSGNSLIANKNLITKIYFPRFLLPAAACLSGLLDFIIATTLLFGMLWYYGMGFSWELFFWPVLVLPLFVLSLGVGLMLSALNVYYRDIKYTIPFVVSLWMFLSPIIYPMSMIPEKYQLLAAINPVGGIIEAFRSAVVIDRQIDWHAFGISSMVALLVFVFGYLYFRRAEREFADVI